MDWILNWIWQGTLIALLVPAVLAVTRRMNASTKYGICWVALAGVVLLPAGAWAPEGSAGSPEVTAFSGTDSLPTAVFTVPPSPAWVFGVLAAAWLLWVVQGGGRLFHAARLIRALKKTCVPVPERRQAGLPLWRAVRVRGRRARLCVSDALPVPAALGFGEPVIAFPRHLFDTLSPAEIDQIVLHEYAHVQRRDDWGRLAQMILHAGFGWHPGVVRLGRSLELEREVACDEWVVARTQDALGYADCLTRLAARRLRATGLRLAPGMFDARSSLTRRVQRLLSGCPLQHARISRRQLVVAATLLTGSFIALRSFSPVVRTEMESSFAAAPVIRPVLQVPDETRISPAVITAAGPIDTEEPLTSGVQSRRVRSRGSATRGPDGPTATVPPVAGPVEFSEPLASVLFTSIATMVTIAPAAPDLVTARRDESSERSQSSDPQEDSRPSTAARSSSTPWGAAADASVAAASGLARASVRTGGFFTSVGRSIADAF